MAEVNGDLVKRIENLNTKKTELETTVNLKKQNITNLKEEIKAKGFDPEKLADTIKETQERITNFEQKALPVVERIENSIQAVSNDQHSANTFSGF